ncbi:MAG: hypothetical protein PUA61_02280, partial [Succinatimonas hippei]|nr:hypothetical protein [Succinatimonas hippei]
MSIQENNQEEELFKGLAAASKASDTSSGEDAELDLGISDSLGKLASRSSAFKQRLEDFDAIKIGLASPEMIHAWS